MTGSAPATPSISSILDSTYYSLTSNLSSGEAKQFTKLQERVASGKSLSNNQQSLYQSLLTRSTSTGDQGMYSKFLDIQSEYGPKFVQQALDLQKQYLPQFEQAQVEAIKSTAPGAQFYANQTKLGAAVNAGIGTGLSKSDLDFFTQQTMQGQQSRGVAASGLGAEQTGRTLTALNLQQKQQNEVNAQNYLSGFSLTPQGGVNPAVAGQPGATAAPNFTDILNQATQFSTLAYQTQATQSTSNATSMNSLFGSLISAAGSGAAMSDARLKEGVTTMAIRNGIRIVKFMWNATARALGLPAGEQTGVIAQEVPERFQVDMGNGLIGVNYPKLLQFLKA